MSFEQIGQSAVKRLWRQKRLFTLPSVELGSGRGAAKMREVRTAIVSDLHLGSFSKIDLLRNRRVLERLLPALEGADQLVVLGDVLELRESSRPDAVRAAAPVLAELGDALGGGRVVLVPGNHDYRLAAPLLRRVPRPLALEQRMTPAPSDPLGPLAASLGSTELVLAYPGIWVRPDVYATHGHYMDYHASVPTFECLAVGVAKRLSEPPAGARFTVDEYEAALAPVYATIDRLVSRSAGAARREALGSSPTLRLWERLTAGDNGDGKRRAAQLVAQAVVPPALAAVNRAGLGSFSPDLSGAELRRAALRATHAFVARLAIDADHVVFGHTHRAGPTADDDRDEWRAVDGPALTNCGSWAYQPAFLTATPGESPWWPGTLVLLEGGEPPRVESLLADMTHEELRPE